MMQKTIKEINQKIKKKQAVIVTAAEFKKLSLKHRPEQLCKKVDVVTTATFGPMCSSGAFLNFGHSSPPMRYERISLNGVNAYGGIAAADAHIGATEESSGNQEYGGAHVIEDLIAGKEIIMKAHAKGTDCYPRRETEARISLGSINEALMFNPRNAYQNYAAATNSTEKTLYTYMGTLLPAFGNVTYSTSGELSPLLNDPDLKYIGIGTRIFLGGASGYVVWNGTQHFTGREKNRHNIPLGPAATIAVTGSLKDMNTRYIRAACYEKYGTSLFVGIGVPVAVKDAATARALSVRNRDIETLVFDYGMAGRPSLGQFNYEQLMSGEIELNGRRIPTASLSSVKMALEICDELRNRILSGSFLLTDAVASLPGNNKIHQLK